MVLKGFSVRNKLLLSFMLVFVPLIIAGGVVAYIQVRMILEKSIKKRAGGYHQRTCQDDRDLSHGFH